jgi:hypothetical protein
MTLPSLLACFSKPMAQHRPGLKGALVKKRGWQDTENRSSISLIGRLEQLL